MKRSKSDIRVGDLVYVKSKLPIYNPDDYDKQLALVLSILELEENNKKQLSATLRWLKKDLPIKTVNIKHLKRIGHMKNEEGK